MVADYDASLNRIVSDLELRLMGLFKTASNISPPMERMMATGWVS
jgi:hypothetical protein